MRNPSNFPTFLNKNQLNILVENSALDNLSAIHRLSLSGPASGSGPLIICPIDLHTKSGYFPAP